MPPSRKTSFKALNSINPASPLSSAAALINAPFSNKDLLSARINITPPSESPPLPPAEIKDPFLSSIFRAALIFIFPASRLFFPSAVILPLLTTLFSAVILISPFSAEICSPLLRPLILTTSEKLTLSSFPPSI